MAVQSGEVVSAKGEGKGEGGGAAVGGGGGETGWALGKKWSDELKTSIQLDRGSSAGSTQNGVGIGIGIGSSSSAAVSGQAATRTNISDTHADVLSDLGGRGCGSVPGEKDIEENGIDETLARCWLIVHSVAAGWGQRDLLEDLEDMFR